MKIILACIALLAAAQAAPSELVNPIGLPEAARYVEPINTRSQVPRGPSGRIVGGAVASTGQIPYQASLVIDSSALCGGSLIAAQWVLTAAHCASKTSVVQVTLGGLNRDLSVSDEGRIVVLSSRVVPHVLYNSYSMRNDILLVQLAQEVTFTSSIQPVKLATDSSLNYVGATARVSGFGKPSDDESPTKVLKYVDVKVIPYFDCYWFYGLTIYDGSICTQELDASAVGNSCSGDSGGPLVDNASGLLIGVVSFGSTNGCESGDPKGLSRVTYFVSWIKLITGLTF